MEKIIYVCSGKGGVGKTTVAVNLAYALAERGSAVGLYDADFQGPNVGSMIRGEESAEPRMARNDLIEPGRYGGVDAFSMDLVFDTDEGIYLSGKHLEGAIDQTLDESTWDVEYLVVDLPPGTGELHRTILEKHPGKAIVVTTPHSFSQENIEKELELLERFDVDRLGLVANLTSYVCDDCGASHDLLPGNAAEELVERHGLTELMTLPFDVRFGDAAEAGVPYVVAYPDTDVAEQFQRTAENLTRRFTRVRNVRPTGD